MIPIAAALLAAGILIAFFIWRSHVRSSSRPNILFVTFDTTRADHIGAYGWRHARRPAIDGLARDGVLFKNAYAPIGLTLLSHTSMMTGLYPFYNGVRDNTHF